ncbi:hypothetical protein NE236_06400 [Actinoallomurus purpureus]|uniref:hypothetical protein n=1 Tax=Actinoallomurus purpureus TaxID=478114 RepID=UPI002092DFDF|nr:hypothetical protein [Actinoallomurus purpureus]MCO6004605.1 hypothetical protein [Actinoallomurus purpureus]
MTMKGTGPANGVRSAAEDTEPPDRRPSPADSVYPAAARPCPAGGADPAVPRPRPMDVYRQWWLHDARWYQGVAKRFGHAAANEINAEALRYVAVNVGKRVRRQFGGGPAADMEELRRRYDACSEWMFPSELRDGGTTVVADGEIELTMRQNFAVTMVRMAGSLEATSARARTSTPAGRRDWGSSSPATAPPPASAPATRPAAS